VRPETLLELARERDVPLPADDGPRLARAMCVTDAQSLEDYLEPFGITLSVLQDSTAIERVAFELGEDHAEENIRYAEVRFCPVLCTKGGLSAEQVLDAALDGLRRAERVTGIRLGLIVCALRSLPASVSCEMAELAVAYHGRGVCGFDLAGAEEGHPVRDHIAAFRVALAAGVPITIHAGEGFGPESIAQALELGHATRIGHGTRLVEDADLLDGVRRAGVTLEVCLTSNVQTRVVSSHAAHPLRRLYDQGVRVALCTDNRLMSAISLTDEYEHARDALGFSWDELVEIARTGFEAAFVSDEVRSELLRDYRARLARID